MPTVRRRQRLSSSCTAPAERSPAISSRAMSLLISTGRLISASVSRSPSLKAKRASPSGRPLRSSARMTPSSVPPVEARSTFTVSAPAALSAAASACAVGSPPVTMETVRPSVARARPVDEFRAAAEIDAVGEPDHLHVGAWRRAGARWSAARRCARRRAASGLSCLSRTRAAAGGCSEMSRPASPSGTMATPRLSASARATMSSAVRSRASQLAAAPKPSSIRSAIGVAPVVVATGGFHKRTGGGEDHQRREREPQQRQPPRRARRRVFLRLDVEQQPRRRKLDAPRPRRNEPQQPPQHRQAEQAEQHERLGEAERQAHHADLPSAMPCGRRLDDGRVVAFADAGVQRQQEFVGRPVGAVDGEAPAELAVSARISSRWRASRAS